MIYDLKRIKKLFHKTTSGSACGGCCFGGGIKGGGGTKAWGSGGAGNGGNGGAEAWGWGGTEGVGNFMIGGTRIGMDLWGTLFCCWPTIASVDPGGLSPAAPGTGVFEGEVADGDKEDASSSWYSGNRWVTCCRCFRNEVMLFRMSIKTINLPKCESLE